MSIADEVGKIEQSEPLAHRPPAGRGLSSKILLLSIAFVLVGEILIFVPSIARFRLVYFQERIAAAHLATLAIENENYVDMPLEDALLQHSGTLAITLYRPEAELMLGKRAPVAMTYNLEESTPLDLIIGAFDTLRHRGERLIGVYGPAPQQSGNYVGVVLAEAPLYVAMVDYSRRIILLSIFLSLFIASLIFLSLRYLIVRPLRRITQELELFRHHPEDASLDPPPRRRLDEIGIVDSELLRMRRGLRQALQQRTRLAALGAAVGKISHDLRNILSSAVLVSDRLELSDDPQVRKTAPRLIEALNRASALASQTLDFAKSRPFELTPTAVKLVELGMEVVRAADGDNPNLNLMVSIDPGIIVRVDREQMFRALFNVVRNGIEALDEQGGEVGIRAIVGERGLKIRIDDSGSGIPQKVRDHLFEPFGQTTKRDGTGLGLAIAREILRAHGGDAQLLQTDSSGTTFELALPSRAVVAGA